MAGSLLNRSDSPVARWWQTRSDGRIQCDLCPRYCALRDGQSGFCFVRRNDGGVLVSDGYGRPTGFAIDPIEKKPLNHFLPGTGILSFGTAGCNMGCKFCQNWTTSKARIDRSNAEAIRPEEIVAAAVREGCQSIAYTYNEPIIFGEFVIDVSRLAREAGLKNVMVTAGYITPEARGEVFEYIDGANVDLKAFTNSFYQKMVLAHIDPIKETLIWLRRETEVWFEITTLVIPGLNDAPEELARECAWIANELGTDIPVHFTAFHPDFRLLDTPRTPPETLNLAREIAAEHGLRYVYTGNVHDPDGHATNCHECNALLVRRDWHTVVENRLDSNRCPECECTIPGVFG